MNNDEKNIFKLFDKETDLSEYADSNVVDYIDIVNQQLREPVTNIFASLPLLAESINSQNTEKSIETLQSVYHKSYQMLKSIHNMSLGAKLLGEREFSKEHIDLSSLVKSVFESSKMVLPDCCDINLDIENGCIVTGNVTLLTSMLLNILLNSFDYKKDDVKIDVTLKVSQDRCVLSYRDNSIGIKPELSDKVFKPYFSSNPYNDGEAADKMGLGLYIAKQAVLNAGGTILLQTEFSEGIKLVISIPEHNADGTEIVKSKTKDFMLNKYSEMFIMLCDYCTLPDLL